MAGEDQLCWKCRKATGGCRWAEEGEPVEGWTAEKTYITNGCESEVTESYRITKCPLFEKDKPRPVLLYPGDRIMLKELDRRNEFTAGKLKRLNDKALIRLAEKNGFKVKVERIGRVRVVKAVSPAIVFREV